MALSAVWQATDADSHPLAGRLARRRAFAHARSHSRRVAMMRVLLPLAGLLAVAGFVVRAHIGFPGNIDLSAAKLSVTRDAIIMDHPRLTGFGGDSREYSVSAKRAIQPLTSPEQVRLEEITAQLTADDNGETNITADAGDYDHQKSTLQLLGAITVNSAEGYRVRMTDAHVDFGAGTLVSDNPVSIGYGDSEITGSRLTVGESGKHIVVEGNVRTVLMPPKRAAPPAPAQE